MKPKPNQASALLGTLVSSLLIAVGPISAKETIQRDSNEKVCQVITPVGSRIATRKFCATRAEWEDKKRQDREAVEKAQTLQCKVIQGQC